MKDISHKQSTLRVAEAQAILQLSLPETIDTIEKKSIPGGDIFETSRTAGLLAIKKAHEIFPGCHPKPIENISITFSIEKMSIRINVMIKTIYKVGVDLEAMHGAGIVALNMYDMLKPLDKNIKLKDIRLISETGSKSNFNDQKAGSYKAVVVVCSDTISSGTKEDKAGKAVIAKLEECQVIIDDYIVIPDELNEIRRLAEKYCAQGIDMIIFTGGTGLSSRDITPEALEPLIERRIPGMEEAIRKYGQDRTPYSMLSRSIAGMRKNTLLLAIPGSTAGARESMDAIFPAALHIFKVKRGERHS